MTLYDKIKKIETEIKTIQENVEYLKENNWECKGKLPDFSTEVKNLLEDGEYKDNPIIQKLRCGEDLNEICDEILSERRYSLKFGRKKRKKYNKKVDELSEIIPYTNKLRSYSIFHVLANPESLFIYMPIITTSISSSLIGTGIGLGLATLITSLMYLDNIIGKSKYTKERDIKGGYLQDAIKK